MDLDARDMNEDLEAEGIQFTGGSPMKVDEEADAVTDDEITSEEEGVEEAAEEEVSEDDEQDANALDIPYDDSDSTPI